jgi:hypothetical protein
LRDTSQVVELLAEVDADQVVRAWFIGMNPQLEDEAPAELIADGRHRRDPATPAPPRHPAPQRAQPQPTTATAHRRPDPRSHRGDDGGDADGFAGTPTAHRTTSHHPRRNSSPGGRIMDNTTRGPPHRAAGAEAMASASTGYCRIPRPIPHHRDRAARTRTRGQKPTTRRRTREDRPSKGTTSEQASTQLVGRTASRSDTEPTRAGPVN